MNRILTLIILAVFCLTFSGCFAGKTDGVRLINGKPEWFYHPSDGSSIGGVGVSGIHVDGKTGQKTLAMQRALEEIARQMGVKVQSFSSLKSVSDSTGSAVSGESSSFFTVDGSEVKARIKAMWEDPYTEELYVWMVTE
ncbi:MAG: hypothetical protein AB7F25_00905 [Deferribacterales bacterium]